MPDLTDPSTGERQATAKQTGPAQEPAAGAGDDPLAKLYHMSTTAGRGSQEYVAINHTAVAAFLLGLGSLAALIHPLLLLIPVAALVCSVLAVWQINRSNGTQAGKGLAILGLALGLAIGGFIIVRQIVSGVAQRADRQAIASMVSRLGQTISAGDYDTAYGMFSDAFRERVSATQFRDTWESVQSSPDLGRVESMRSNELVEFEPPTATGEVTGHAGALLKFQKGTEESRMGLVFVKRGGTWQIQDLPVLFPKERGGRRGGGSQGP